MRALLFLYALSGLFSLGYQVVWLRHFVDRFGSSTLTFALVISCFIGGLGAGSLASRRVTEALRRLLPGRHDLALYGVVEMGIAVTALLVFAEALVPVDLLGSFPYQLEDGIWEPTLAHQALKVPVAALTILVPCFLMGVTYPLLCSVYRADARFPSRLYAWNTAGACTAVLLCEWVFLRWVGHDRTLLGLAGANLLLGLGFLLRGSALQEKSGGEDAAPRADSPASASVGGALLACAIVSGFLAGALEADAFRRVHFAQVFNGAAMAFVSFWAILAIFLASATVSAWRRASFNALRVVYTVALLVFIGTVTLWILPLRAWLEGFIATATEANAWDPDGTATILFGVFLIVGAVVFPTYYGVSMLLPWVCNQAQARGAHLGRLYGWNTLAFLLGMVCFNWLAPQVNMFYAFKLVVLVFAIGVGFLWLLRLDRGVGLARVAAVGGALTAAALMTPREFDHDFLPDTNPVKGHEIVSMKGSAGWTVFIAANPLGNAIYLDTAKMSDTNTEVKRYMKVMAHLPLLSIEEPRRALLICFGVGNTAASIVAHSSLEEIDIVDLNRPIFESAPYFDEHNGRAYADPRVRLIHDDGRSFLDLSDRTYDLVTSEPPPPLMHGIDRLYSREYYEAVLEHLTPEGLMSQWLPIYQMPPKAGELIVRTFVQTFPHSVLVTGTNKEFLLIGSKRPLDWATLVARFDQDPRVRADLLDVDVTSGVALASRLVMTNEELRAHYGEGRVVTDQRNPLAAYWPTGRMELFPFTGSGALYVLPQELLAEPQGLAASFRDPEVLLTRVPDFPFESLAVASPEALPAAEGFDWLALQELNLASSADFGAGRLDKGLAESAESLRQFPAQLPVYYERAQALARGGRPAEGLAVLEEAARRFPDQPRVHYMLGLVRASAGQRPQAIDELQEAVRLHPRYFEARYQLGMLLGQARQRDAALVHLRAARKLRPKDPRIVELFRKLGL